MQEALQDLKADITVQRPMRTRSNGSYLRRAQADHHMEPAPDTTLAYLGNLFSIQVPHPATY